MKNAQTLNVFFDFNLRVAFPHYLFCFVEFYNVNSAFIIALFLKIDIFQYSVMMYSCVLYWIDVLVFHWKPMCEIIKLIPSKVWIN